MEGHNWHNRSCSSFVPNVLKKNGFEIFDSILMLETLFSYDKVLSVEVKRALYFVVALNFLLPTVSLFRANRKDFGRKSDESGRNIKFWQNITRFVLVDIFYFVIRMHIFLKVSSSSAFIIKNIMNIGKFTHIHYGLVRREITHW
mgnify:CR=1 FL=1